MAGRLPSASLLALVVVASACASSSPPRRPLPPRAPAAAQPPPPPPERCAFDGPLRVDGALWSAAAGGTVLERLSIEEPVQAEELRLPEERGGRAYLRLEDGREGWLDAKARPLELRRRFDVLPGHVWLDEGFPVRATAVKHGVEIEEELSPSLQLSVRVVRATLPCTALAPSAEGFVPPVAGPESTFVDLGEGVVPVYAGPGGARMGSVLGGQWAVLERAGEWLQVGEAEPVHVRVWVRSSFARAVSPSEGTTLQGGIEGPR